LKPGAYYQEVDESALGTRPGLKRTAFAEEAPAIKGTEIVTEPAATAFLGAVYRDNGPGRLNWVFPKPGQVLVPDDGRLDVTLDGGLAGLDLKKAGLAGELLVQDLPDLRRFSVKGDRLAAVVLRNLPYLEHIKIAGAGALTLENLPALEGFNIRDHSLKTLTLAGGLGVMPCEAQVESRALSRLEVKGRNDINELYIEDSRIRDLRPFRLLSNIVHLGDKSRLLSDLTPLEGLGISRLILKSPRLRDLEPLGKMKYVHELMLTGDGITDLRPLVKLKDSLNWLDVTSNNLTDISPLAEMELGTLGLFSDALTDLSPLAKMTSLWDLVLEGKNLKDFSPLAEVEAGLTNYVVNDCQLKQPTLGGQK
jgi:Leucine-rich repeat (LRR) protein